MQLSFFATNSDLKEVLSEFEQASQINYNRAGLLDNKDIKVYSSLINENIGIATTTDSNTCVSFLILDRRDDVKIRTISQNDGGQKFAIDQLKNPSSIFFRPGGIIEENKAIIEGKIGTVSSDQTSIQIFNAFSKIIKQKFSKLKGYYLGNQASKLLKEGWRLTQNVNAPKDYDLVYEKKEN